jgi:hypothetical protein
MSDYFKKRIAYINNWPNSEPFEAEKNYKIRCDHFFEKYGYGPFSPLKLWEDDDDTFNRTISHLIDGLEMMPIRPNFAFTFAFSGLDCYTKHIYSGNTTISLKKLAEDIDALAAVNSNIKAMLAVLFSTTTVNANQYLYKYLCGNSNHNSNVKARVTTDSANINIPLHSNIVDEIYNRYGYDPTNYNASMRQAALLYRKAFENDNLTIADNAVVITDRFRLYLLLLGLVYSLRNDAMHGSSMSSTKSSKTTPERYALNYYAFLATYNVLMTVLIMKSSLSQAEKDLKYTELRQNTEENVDRFRKLFGSHIN